jgi:hypothetical protein
MSHRAGANESRRVGKAYHKPLRIHVFLRRRLSGIRFKYVFKYI